MPYYRKLTNHEISAKCFSSTLIFCCGNFWFIFFSYFSSTGIQLFTIFALIFWFIGKATRWFSVVTFKLAKFCKTVYSSAEEIMLFSLVIVRNLCHEAWFCVKSKTNSRFTVKLLKEATDLSLVIWWITFFEHVSSLICDNEMYRTCVNISERSEAAKILC